MNSLRLCRLLHGYVALPVIRACEQSGLFELLSKDSPVFFDDINEQLRANSGHLKASLRLLELLGWLNRTAQGAYLFTELADRRETVHPDIFNLYQQPVHDLSKWFNSVLWHSYSDKFLQQDQAECSDKQDAWCHYLDGPFLVPLLMLLQQQGIFADA